MNAFEKRAGISTAGLLGANTLMNYRVGLDYAHSTVYFDIGRLFNFPEFDVIGLILRPEDDGRFTILGIADYDGKPSVPEGQNGVQADDHLVAVDGIPIPGATMGQVWSMLGGSPGTERTLTIERGGKQFTVVAKVRHFLGETDGKYESKGKSHKN
jgi:C-terminal processing protease CtpA/Prc